MISSIKNSINKKFFLITSTILIISSIIIYIFLIIIMPVYYARYNEKKTEVIINEFSEKLKNYSYEDSKDTFDGFFTDNTLMLIIVLFDEDGNYVKTPSINMLNTFSTDGEDVTEEEFRLSYDYSSKAETRNPKFPKGMVPLSYNIVESKLIVSDIVFNNNDKYNGYFLYDIQPINEATDVMIRLIPYIFIIIIVVSSISSLLYSRYITKPIIKISKTAEKMSKEKDLNIRCDVSSNDEIGIMSASINGLTESLSQSLEELKGMNVILQDDIEKEKEMDKKRRDLFNAVSHELKTPITIIKGQLEGMINNVGVYKDRDEFLYRSLGVADKMEELVEEILMISKMEENSFKLKLERIDFKDLLEEVVEELEGLTDKNEIIIKNNIENNIIFEVDYRLFKKAISNVVKNAIVHSPKGATVSVNAERHNNQISIEVRNTGVIIPSDEIENIFNPYYRIEKSRSRNTGGSGMGLYIVKNILDSHKIGFQMQNIDNSVSFKCNINLNLMEEKINLYVDDLRDCPHGFVIARTVEQAKYYLENFQVAILSLDHDLGMDEQGKIIPTGYDLVKYFCEKGLKAEKIYIHTDNSVGRENMYQTLLGAQRRGFIGSDIKIYHYSITQNKYSGK